MSVTELHSYIINYVLFHKSVSLIDIEELLDSLAVEYKGSCTLVHPENSNITLWHGWSCEIVNIIKSLIAINCICIELTSAVTYLKHGKYIDLPIMVDENDYKEKRWLPIVLKVNKDNIPGYKSVTNEY